MKNIEKSKKSVKIMKNHRKIMKNHEFYNFIFPFLERIIFPISIYKCRKNMLKIINFFPGEAGLAGLAGLGWAGLGLA